MSSYDRTKELIDEINVHINKITIDKNESSRLTFRKTAREDKLKVLKAAKLYLTGFLIRDAFEKIIKESKYYSEAFSNSVTKKIINKVLKETAKPNIKNVDIPKPYKK